MKIEFFDCDRCNERIELPEGEQPIRLSFEEYAYNPTHNNNTATWPGDTGKSYKTNYSYQLCKDCDDAFTLYIVGYNLDFTKERTKELEGRENEFYDNCITVKFKHGNI